MSDIQNRSNHGWSAGSARGAGGSRSYKLWVPNGLQPGVASPLLVFLHGCTHGAEEMAEISGMNDVAEANKFLVVYPEQSLLANLLKCWNWFEPKHQSRDAGEPSIFAAIVEDVCARYSVDSDRIYVAGVSAGGAMAVIAGATYPDIFAAIGVFAGGEFRAATGVSSALTVLKHGGPDPIQQGQLAYAAMKEGVDRKPKRRMPVIVFHGTADDRVNPVNAEQIIAQWSETNACLATHSGERDFRLSELLIAGQIVNGYAYRRYIYSDQTGALLMERWMVDGLGHAWSGSPRAHGYGDPKGPRASEEIWRFFSQVGLNSGKSSIAP